MTARALSLGLAVALLGCSHAPVTPGEDELVLDAADGGVSGGACTRFGAPVRTGNNPAALPEMSGLVSSARHAGISWAHNDSGNALELFALREDGTVAARIPLTGASNIDVEDLAVGPCAEGTCLFLGDIGDNREVRSVVHLYRLPEPEVLDDTPRAVVDLPFRYADRAHNAESLVVDPASGTPYVLTKGLFTLGDIYRVEGVAPGTEGVAVKLGTLQNPAFDQLSTAADAHPSAPELLLRTYGRVWLYRAPPGGTLEQALLASPTELPAPSQPQSEAIAWLPGGRGYLVGTEGAGEGLFRVECAP